MADPVPLMTEEVCRVADHAINNQLTVLSGQLAMLNRSSVANLSGVSDELLIATHGIHRVVSFLRHVRQPEVSEKQAVSADQIAQQVAERIQEHGPVVAVTSSAGIDEIAFPLPTVKLIIEEFLCPMLMGTKDFPANVFVTLKPLPNGSQLAISFPSEHHTMPNSYRELLDTVTKRRLEMAGVKATIERREQVELQLFLA